MYPALFFAHGAPTLALDRDKGADFARWSGALDPPKALLVVSAHWQTATPTLGTESRRELIYDFSGFPDPLYRVRYDSPGAPQLAARVRDLVPEVATEPDRGLDHGVWVPLVHMWPEADVPVLQLSLPRTSPEQLVALGRKLAPLRREGVAIVGSGNLTHNLRELSWKGPGEPPSWAKEYDDWCRGVLDDWQVDALIDYRQKAPHLGRAHPTHEHFLPLLVAVGAAGASRPVVRYPVSGFEYGSLSRRSAQLG